MLIHKGGIYREINPEKFPCYKNKGYVVEVSEPRTKQTPIIKTKGK